jgi:DNA polymerase
VLLGATAATALVGPGFSVMRERGKPIDLPIAERVVATVHPSSILRARSDREAAFEALVKDLASVARWLARRAV